MSRKVPLILFIVALVFALFGAGVWVYMSVIRADQLPGENATSTDGFFPFGSGDNETRNLTSTTTENNRVVFDQTRHENLWQVTKEPVAGATLVKRQLSDNEVQTRIRYIERETGHIYEVDPERGLEVQLTNTRVPRLQEAQFVGEGNAVILRYLENDDKAVQTFLARIEDNTGTRVSEVEGEEAVRQNRFWNFTGRFLPANIIDITASPDGDGVLYLLPAPYGSRGVRVTIDGSETKEIFQHALRELSLAWPSASMITLTTKPSIHASGLLFTVSPTSGTSRVVISGTKGLSTLTDPGGNTMVYFSGNQVPVLSAYSFINGGVSQLSLVTIPEKCVWSNVDAALVYCAVPNQLPGKEFPDSWYKGTISLQDLIWKIDLRTGRTDILLAPNDFETTYQLDAVDLHVDEADKYMLFKNRLDQSLWRLRLN